MQLSPLSLSLKWQQTKGGVIAQLTTMLVHPFSPQSFIFVFSDMDWHEIHFKSIHITVMICFYHSVFLCCSFVSFFQPRLVGWRVTFNNSFYKRTIQNFNCWNDCGFFCFWKTKAVFWKMIEIYFDCCLYNIAVFEKQKTA